MVQTAISIGTSIATILVAVYLLRSQKAKLQAEEATIIKDAAMSLIEPLRLELAIQRDRRHQLELRLAQTEARLSRLETWIVETTGVDPATINGD